MADTVEPGRKHPDLVFAEMLKLARSHGYRLETASMTGLDKTPRRFGAQYSFDILDRLRKTR